MRDNHDRGKVEKHEAAQAAVEAHLRDPSAPFDVPTDDIVCQFAKEARPNVGNAVWLRLPASSTRGPNAIRRPDDLDRLSRNEEALATQLIEEIEEQFLGTPGAIYEFEPASGGAFEFNDRVKREVIKRARAAGWIASDLDGRGGFTVRKPS
jgi:hypothetical protein